MSQPILARVALSHAPLIDRRRLITATRLTVFPLKAGEALDAGELIEALTPVWPEGGPALLLDVLSESLLHELMAAQPARHIGVEVPAAMALDPAHTAVIQALAGRGNTLLLKGRPARELPRELLDCFQHAVVPLAEDRRLRESAEAAAHPARRIGTIQSGVHTLAELDACFARGAVAVLGWPVEDALARGRAQGSPDLQVTVELMRQVEAGASPAVLEATLARDPALALRLLRHLNAPGFGLAVEVSSFRHALLLLGHQRLKRWLALLLATAVDDLNLQPLMLAALRRGLVMEAMLQDAGYEDLAGELFIAGLFSLLDRLLGQPFETLLASVPVPERVRRALVGHEGPLMPYLRLAQAVEGEALDPIREAFAELFSYGGETNVALLSALGRSHRLQ